MSTYKEIRGLKVRDYTTNPDNPIEGQLWYNTTDNVAKYQIPNVLSSWATTGPLNQVKRLLGGVGIQTAALAFGGDIPPTTVNTETFNGSSWTEVNNLNTSANSIFGFGTTSSAIGAGFNPGPGSYTGSESWNG